MDSQKKLYKTGVFYRQLGYSVIPIHGENVPQNFKAAAVRWQRFQKRPPNEQQIEDWFLKQGHGGIAIVCGAVSGLAVLDFDDEDLATLFAELHPDLAQTRVVRSGGRGLPHYYYRLPASAKTRSRSVPGVDWQYNGRYVVAPPTSGHTGTWQVEHDTAPLFLTEADLSRVMAFIEGVGQLTGGSPSEGASGRCEGLPASSVPSSPGVQTAPLSLEGIVNYYRANITHGRNNALFETCCWVRDRGGTIRDVSPLIDVHAHEPPLWAHPPETTEKRRAEALRTIESAFSRPPAFRAKPKYKVIPNLLREAMLAHKQTPLLRVLECMVSAGWRAGQTFTRRELVELAKDNEVGDWSVRRALEAHAPDDSSVIGQAATGAVAAAGDGAETPQLNAIELSETKPTQNRGRPPRLYQMPDLRVLCARYGVKWSGGDVLDRAALRGAARYRQALHVEFLKRQPGQYYRDWLAGRLGVSVRTLCRYNQRENINVQPMYNARRLSWKRLGLLPKDLQDHHFGSFLEDETGKRYPPLVPIACKLLRQRKPVTYKCQTANHYSVPAAVPDASARANGHAAPLPFETRSLPQPEASPQTAAPPPNLLAADSPVQQEKDALTDYEEQTATALHEASRGTLSLRRAKQLVAKYGRFAATDVLQTLGERGEDVDNPAGFVTALLESRYSPDPESPLSGDDVANAESLYLLAEWHTPAKKLRWDKCLQLVQEHNAAAVQELIKHLGSLEQGALFNAAGYIITRLRQSKPLEVKTYKDAVQAMMTVTRKLSETHAMSRKTAEELAGEYSRKLIAKALDTVQKRENVDNPTGFVIVFLRSESKAQEREKQRRWIW